MAIVCFGAFEADTRSGELRRKGTKVRVQAQPFQVLALLLRHPGEVVTREELTKELWPEDTFIEFERDFRERRSSRPGSPEQEHPYPLGISTKVRPESSAKSETNQHRSNLR